MKKAILFLVVISLSFMACEGPQGPMGPIGPDGGGGVRWHTVSIKIDQSQWSLAGNPGNLNSFFYADVSINELTDFVYREGTVIAYIETESGIKNGLPFVSHRGSMGPEGRDLWTQTFDFDFYKGGMSFYLTYSDFDTRIRPGNETFHVVLMW